MVLPETALGPVVGPFQRELVFCARRTAASALAKAVGQPALDGPGDGKPPGEEPRSQPAMTVVAAASSAAAAGAVLRFECTGGPCRRKKHGDCRPHLTRVMRARF